MTDRCIEIHKDEKGISAKVVDKKGNQLKPTEEEKEYMLRQCLKLMFSTELSFEELGK